MPHRIIVPGLAFAIFVAAACAAPAPRTAHFPAGASPGSVAVADVNGDGKPDILVANQQAGTVSVLLGDGHGRFASPRSFPAGHNPNDIAVADLNHDGKLDLAFANHDEQYITVLLGDGRGGFAPAPGSPVHVDVYPHPHGIAAADFNGDGKIDLITDSWGHDQLRLLWGDGTGRFVQGPLIDAGKHPYEFVRASDVNGDGHADILATDLDSASVSLLFGDGKGGFRPASFPANAFPFCLAAGDVNSDGKVDLVIGNGPAAVSGGQPGTNGITILLGDGRGSFSMLAGSPFAMNGPALRIAIGDLNGDGINDVVASDTPRNEITVLTMNRNGIESKRSIPVARPRGVAIADLDGDGHGDIVVASETGDEVVVIFGH